MTSEATAISVTIPFSMDSAGSVTASRGGSTMLPMTVILDASGTIVYNKTGSITHAERESIVEPLL